MHLFKKEVKTYRKSFFIWMILSLIIIVSGFSKYTALIELGNTVNELMEAMPKLLQYALGYYPGLDLTKFGDYMAYLMVYSYLLGAFYSVVIGAKLLSKEANDKTESFLFLLPITREKTTMIKFFVGIFYNVSYVLITTIVLVMMSYWLNNGADLNMIYWQCLGQLGLQLTFFAISFGPCQLFGSKKATSFAMYIIAISYILARTVELFGISHFNYLLIFKLYDPIMLHQGGKLYLSSMLTLFILGVSYMVALRCINIKEVSN